MLEEWDELITFISLLWHQPREYVLQQEMDRIWEIVRIQYKKAHPKEDLVSPEEILDEIDESQKATFRAQERARKKREQELKDGQKG